MTWVGTSGTTTGPVPARLPSAATLLALTFPEATCPAATAPPAPTRPAAVFAVLEAGAAWKTWTAKPSATDVPASGSWAEILPFGFGGCGCTVPRARPASISFCCANPRGSPTIPGTVALPVPVTVTTSTTVPFLALAPAAGL